jgi:DNA-binding CsgD family transcriptional regulator
LEFFSTARQPPDKHLLYIVESIGEQLGRVLERQRGRELERQAVAIAGALTLTTIRSESLEATLNALSSAVYLTDRYGQIVYMNRAAERQVNTGNAIRVAHNHIAPIDRTARLALARAIDEAIGIEADRPISGSTIALRGEEDTGLIATILPLAPGERQSTSSAFSGLAAIFVQDPIVLPHCPGEAFAKLYGLTGSELRVLLVMVPGLSVKQVAKILGVGETTVKTHLQHIYSKTHTSKQTELMHLFMSYTPPVKAA